MIIVIMGSPPKGHEDVHHALRLRLPRVRVEAQGAVTCIVVILHNAYVCMYIYIYIYSYCLLSVLASSMIIVIISINVSLIIEQASVVRTLAGYTPRAVEDTGTYTHRWIELKLCA